jgi:hypothetical protein
MDSLKLIFWRICTWPKLEMPDSGHFHSTPNYVTYLFTPVTLGHRVISSALLLPGSSTNSNILLHHFDISYISTICGYNDRQWRRVCVVIANLLTIQSAWRCRIACCGSFYHLEDLKRLYTAPSQVWGHGLIWFLRLFNNVIWAEEVM